MKSTTPIFRLKRDARRLSRKDAIPLHAALDRIAAQQGFARWSLLAKTDPQTAPAARLYHEASPGDLVLIAARPRQGKTLFALQLAAEAMKAGRHGLFFTLEYNERDVASRLDQIGVPHELRERLFTLDMSNEISADHIARYTASAPRGSVAVIDYLQLLDQRRANPELAAQLPALKRLAVARGVIVAAISQVDRSFETSGKAIPDLGDIRLPNPADLSLFDRTCFLHGGEVQLGVGG